jgi:hypothetical protein
MIGQLAHYNKQLRVLVFQSTEGSVNLTWDMSVEGLPDGVPVDLDEPYWRPDAALAALTGLEQLSADGHLHVGTVEQWECLAQLPGLTKLADIEIEGTLLPWPAASPQEQQHQQQLRPLAVVEMENCSIGMGGYGIGQVLLACPQLQRVDLWANGWGVPPLAGTPLPCHPTLKVLALVCYHWHGAGPAAQFADLAPVLASVEELRLRFPFDSSNDSYPSPCLPSMVALTALTSLVLECCHPRYGPAVAGVYLEDVASMLSCVTQLQRLTISDAPLITPRAVLTLQYMLPKLQHVQLSRCGRLASLDGPLQQQVQQVQLQQQQQVQVQVQQQQQQQLQQVQQLQQQQQLLLQRQQQLLLQQRHFHHHLQQLREEKALARIKQLLRPGLVLDVVSGDGRYLIRVVPLWVVSVCAVTGSPDSGKLCKALGRVQHT